MSKLSEFRTRLDRRKIKIAARGAQERRRHNRARITLSARALAPSTGEFDCIVVDVSPGGARIKSKHQPYKGERVVLMVDELGRVEGETVRLDTDGFGIRFFGTQRKRDRLGDVITWRLNMDRLGLNEDRAATRKATRGTTKVQLSDGLIIPVELIDVSKSGAAFACAERPRLGERVRVGGMNAHVARWLENGFAVRFDDQ